jgi:hypothetical protein
MQQMSDPMTAGSRMIRPPGPPGGPYLHPSASMQQQQQQQHHHQQQQQQLHHPHHHPHNQQQQHTGTMMPVQASAGSGATPALHPAQAGCGGDQQILYNVEYLFHEDGKEVRKVPIEMNGETIWVECVEPAKQGGMVDGLDSVGGGVYKTQDSIIMDLNGDGDGKI